MRKILTSILLTLVVASVGCDNNNNKRPTPGERVGTGPQGPQGPQGPAGANGQNGTPGTPGAQGSAGLPGSNPCVNGGGTINAAGADQIAASVDEMGAVVRNQLSTPFDRNDRSAFDRADQLVVETYLRQGNTTGTYTIKGSRDASYQTCEVCAYIQLQKDSLPSGQFLMATEGTVRIDRHDLDAQRFEATITGLKLQQAEKKGDKYELVRNGCTLTVPNYTFASDLIEDFFSWGGGFNR